MTKFPGNCVRFALRGVTAVDHEFHKLDEIRVGTIHDSDTTSSDFTVHGGKTSKEDIVEHENRILTNPVPGRIKVAGLECVKHRLNAIYVCVAVFARNAVEPGLEHRGICFLFVV